MSLRHGDCLNVMAEMEADSVDAIVTDPSYGLRFMGKTWDYDIPTTEQFAEMLRVAKPGAHLLSFGGTRTHHRVWCNVEDAGWEIRDTIFWIYGSGFPKSLDVSKAIDKAGEWNQDFDDVRSWLCEKVKEKGLKHAEINRALGNENSHMASHFLGTSQPMLPTWDQWLVLKKLLGVDEDIDRPPKLVPYERAIIGVRKVNRGVAFTSDGPDELPITAPATDAAKQWDGWGTALKPAVEPIVLARKPLIGTVAENVQEHGTGGLNIDGCRVGTEEKIQVSAGGVGEGETYGDPTDHGRYVKGTGAQQRTGGRWPANVVHDGSEEVVGLFPDTGKSVGGDGSKFKASIFGMEGAGCITPGGKGFGDLGSAARFFYTAKASRAEREAGLSGRKRLGGMRSETSDQHITRRDGGEPGPVRNHHPTVKPIALMRWLCRLITPPAGLILDPFMGSGTTGIAAALEGFRFVGIEQESEYLDIAKARIDHAREQPSLFQLETETP